MPSIGRTAKRLALTLFLLLSAGAAPAHAQDEIAEAISAFAIAQDKGAPPSDQLDRAQALLEADLSATPLTVAERAELLLDIAETLHEGGRPGLGARAEARAIELVDRAIGLAEDEEAASALKTLQVENLRTVADRQRLRDDLTNAASTINRALTLAETLMAPEDDGIRFVLKDWVEIRREAGLEVPAARAEMYAMYFEPLPPRSDEPGDTEAVILPAPIIEFPPLMETDTFQSVRVLFAATREDSGSEDPTKAFGLNRGGASPKYGAVIVTVPKDRQIGSIPRPQFYDFRGPRDGVHVVLKYVDRFEDAPGYQAVLASQMSDEEMAGRSKDAFIFVHGHATDFAGAARRTAQLAVDLDLRSGGIFYAWPASHQAFDYQRSQNNVEYAVPGLVDLIKATAPEVDQLHLIAHSMGNRVLLGALDELQREEALAATPLDQIIWASPDVDADVFARRLSALGTIARGMTLYGSTGDRALKLSKWLGGSYPRAGQTPPPTAVARSLNSVDTSALAQVDSDLINHGDYADGAMLDMRAVIWLSLSPEDRCQLEQVTNDGAPYWRLSPQTDGCSDEAFRRAVSARRLYGENAISTVEAMISELSASEPEEAAAWRDALRILQQIG